MERQVLLKVASDFAEQLHPENEEQVGAVLEAMNDPRPSARIAELQRGMDAEQELMGQAAAEGEAMRAMMLEADAVEDPADPRAVAMSVAKQAAASRQQMLDDAREQEQLAQLRRRELAAQVGPDDYCSPRHPTHFEPSFLESDDFL